MPSFQLNLEGGQLFFTTEGKGTHEVPGYCHQQYFYLEVVVLPMLIHPCRDLSGVIVDNEQDEDDSNFIFLIGAGISDLN